MAKLEPKAKVRFSCAIKHIHTIIAFSKKVISRIRKTQAYKLFAMLFVRLWNSLFINVVKILSIILLILFFVFALIPKEAYIKFETDAAADIDTYFSLSAEVLSYEMTIDEDGLSMYDLSLERNRSSDSYCIRIDPSFILIVNDEKHILSGDDLNENRID